jgi:hypothetical protein
MCDDYRAFNILWRTLARWSGGSVGATELFRRMEAGADGWAVLEDDFRRRWGTPGAAAEVVEAVGSGHSRPHAASMRWNHGDNLDWPPGHHFVENSDGSPDRRSQTRSPRSSEFRSARQRQQLLAQLLPATAAVVHSDAPPHQESLPAAIARWTRWISWARVGPLAVLVAIVIVALALRFVGLGNHERAQAVRGILVLRNVAANGRVVGAAKALEYLTLDDAGVFPIETWHPKVG